MKNKKFFSFFKRNYSEIFSYLAENKNYFYGVIILFLVSVAFGFIFPLFFKEQIKTLILSLMDSTKNLGTFGLVLFIFKNNVLVALFSVVLGILFGIFPIITCIINGYVLGFIARTSVEQAGALVLLRLLPHGVFELPAVLISLGIGLKIGFLVFLKNPRKEIPINAKMAVKIFLMLLLPLLLIAGIIEGVLISLIG